MPTYDYKCEEHGYFAQENRMADHAKGVCPTCKEPAKQVILSAPRPLIEAMADAGLPGALHTSGDRMEKRHREAGAYHTATKAQEESNAAYDRDVVAHLKPRPQ